MIDIIVIIEALATIFYLVAFGYFIKAYKKEAIFGKVVLSIVALAMFVGALASLTDVLEWSGVNVIVVESLEEIFTPIFGVCWLIASFTIFSLMGGISSEAQPEEAIVKKTIVKKK